jgi:Co/Zn/Cd efflux system component
MFSLSFSWLSLILLLMGVLAAILFVDSNDLVNAGIRYLVLRVVYDALGSVPVIGKFFTGAFGGAVAFLGPVLLTTLVVYFVKKYFFAKK